MVNGDARTVDFGCASSVFFARNHGQSPGLTNRRVYVLQICDAFIRDALSDLVVGRGAIAPNFRALFVMARLLPSRPFGAPFCTVRIATTWIPPGPPALTIVHRSIVRLQWLPLCWLNGRSKRSGFSYAV